MSNLPDIFVFTSLSQHLPLEDAIDQAIRQTPEHFILRKYLQAHKTEVKGMLWEEYDKEEYKILFRKEYVQEGIEIGRQEGRAEGRQLILLQMISAKIKKEKQLHRLQRNLI